MKTYIQITAARGPIECACVVGKLIPLLIKDLGPENCEIISTEPHHDSPEGCYMSVILSTTLDDISKLKSSWEGSILWVATKNHFRPNHKRKNWYVGVKFFEESKVSQLKESDVKYEFCRSSGPGGQNVNKVETAVRAIHIPTGLSVRCEEYRSQGMNKSGALERLRLKFTELKDKVRKEQTKVMWSSHDSLERGNPVKKFKGEL